MQWKWQLFEEISGLEMHDILALRQQIFILEQNCVYLDADNLDQRAWHLTGRREQGTIDVYGRLLFPASRFAEPSIGRLLTRKSVRKRGLARKALEIIIAKCKKEYPGQSIRISAQAYLTGFYTDLGFGTVGELYDEDGIDHIEMILEME